MGPTDSARPDGRATTILVMTVVSCPGVLLFHDDGVVLLCTEEARGRPCTGGLARARHAKAASCRLLYATSHCRRCAEHGEADHRPRMSDVA